MSHAELTVDADAVAENTRLFARASGGHLMAVLKADAFGHGDLAPVVLGSGATWLGTTSIDDALALRARSRGVGILSWLNPVDADWRAALVGGIDVAVPSAQHLHAVARAARELGVTARIHLHIDLGINRDGAASSEWAALCELAAMHERGVPGAGAGARRRGGWIRVIGVMGHLSSADTPDAPENARERLLFDNAVRVARSRGLHPVLRHLAASAATLTQPDALYDLSRVGAGLYGIDPSGSTRLRPALTLTAPVVSVKRVGAGAGVGYGHTYRADRASTLALLPVGYADGLPRTASGRAEVQLRGRRYPVAGLFSMDQIVVDVGDDPVSPGDVATLFGPGVLGEPTVADWAGWSGTIEHAVVVGIGARVSRRTIGGAGTRATRVGAPA